jgi:hypothetical protein
MRYAMGSDVWRSKSLMSPVSLGPKSSSRSCSHTPTMSAVRWSRTNPGATQVRLDPCSQRSMARLRRITWPLTITVTPCRNQLPLPPSLLFSIATRSMSPTLSPSRVASPMGTL